MKKSIEQLKNDILTVITNTKELESSVNQVLEMIGQYFDVDRAYIFENIDEDRACTNTFEWCNVGIQPEIQNLQYLNYDIDLGSNWKDNYDEDGLFFCPTISTLPPKQKAILESQGIFSMLHSAIKERGEFKGYIGFDNCKDHLSGWEYDKDAIDTLVFASRLLSLYLLEYRNKVNLQKALDDAVRSNQIINHVTSMDYDYIMVVDAVTDAYQIYANERDVSMSTVAKSGCYSQMIVDYANQYVLPQDRFIAIDELSVDYMVRELETKPEVISQARLTEPDGSECIKRVKISYLNKDQKKLLITRTDITEFVMDENQKKATLERQKELEQKYAEQVEYRNKFTRNAMFSIRMDMYSDEILDYSCADAKTEEIVLKVGSAIRILRGLCGDMEMPTENEIKELGFSLESLKNVYELGRTQYKISDCWNKRLEKYLTANMYMDKNPISEHLEIFIIVFDVTETVLKKKALENVACTDYDFVALIDTETGRLCMMATSDPLLQPLLSKNWDIDYNRVVVSFAETYRNFYQTEDDFRAVSSGIQLSKVMDLLSKMDEYEFTCKTESKEKGVTTFRLRFSFMDETKKYIIFSRTNITEAVRDELMVQQKLKTALEEAKNANKAKTDFLSRMSHDIRTPMNAIIGLTTLSLDEKDISDSMRENLMNIRGASDFLLGLVNDILDMSKIESGSVKLKTESYDYMDFLAKLKSMFEPQCDAKGIQFEFEEVTLSTCILVDRLRMDQIFFNILSNAVKFTPEGGRIAYYTDNIITDGKRISADYIIEDSGIGMSEWFLERIFEPFEQEDTKYSANIKGTGLGLSIAKSLTELMGGTIKIESREGVGTKVIVHLGFELCTVKECSEEKTVNLLEDKNLLHGKHILLVEDHPLNAKIAMKLLEKKGMVVTHAINGKRAVDIFNISNESDYFAILMDIRMPVMDGLEATKNIRLLNHPDAKSVPIIAMSANAYDDDVQKSLDAGMDAHLAKPVDPQRLYQTLADFVNEKTKV